MEALILSCSTGGGHNTAAQAVFEALTERGHHAVRMDPYTSTPSRTTTAIIKILKFLEVNFSMRRTCLSIFI